MSNNTCQISASLQADIFNTRFVTYYIMAPIYCPVGLACHAFFVFALYQQSKKQPAYLYQVFQSVTDTVCVLIRSLKIIGRFAAGQTATGPNYQNPLVSLSKNYVVMWYTGRLSIYFANSIINTTQLLSVSMAADRVFALYKPNTYRSINHRRHQFVALFFSVALSFSASAFDCLRNTLVQNASSGAYSIILDLQYVGTLKALVFAIFISIVQVGGLILLIFFSIALCYLYKTQYVKPKVGTGVNAVEAQGQARVRRSEKTLAFLTITECFFKVVGMAFPTFQFLMIYISPDIFTCINPLTSVLADMTATIVDLGGFFVVIAISKGVRNILRHSLDILKCNGDQMMSSVVPHTPPKIRQ